jgi:CubicO group peptidase (beta-lactamase class C family)
MRRVLTGHVRSAVAAALCLAGAAALAQTRALPSADPAAIGLAPDALAPVTEALRAGVARNEAAGAVALVARRGEIVYFEAVGLRDREARAPMTTDAIFSLASMTKPVIVIAALTLLEQGRFALDDPISRYLPEWSQPQVAEAVTDAGGTATTRLVPARTPITFRQLMSHSSGLYYSTGAPPGVDPKSVPAASPLVASSPNLERFVSALAKTPLKFHPGEGYEYSTSIDVLARYIEVASGMRIDEFLRARVFRPLGMTDTNYWIDPEQHGRIAQLYTQPAPGVLQRGRDMTLKPTVFIGGFGLYGTAMDYGRLCQMLLNRGELDGVRFLRAETVDEMFRNQLRFKDARPFGLGATVDGNGAYAFGGADGTQFWIDRRLDVFGVFMVPTSWYRAPLYGEVRRLVGSALAGIGTSSGAR